MPRLSKDEYQAGRWGKKPRAQWENTYEKPRDEENCPPNLDYKVIEQIADGVEKMILAWSHGEEREAYTRRTSITDSQISTPKNMSRGLQKSSKSPLSEKSFQGEGGSCNYNCPIQIQEVPRITAEISINEDRPVSGMKSAISQIVTSQAVTHTGAVTNKDMHAEKTVTETATYWYMEASNASNQGCRAGTREAEEKPENSGRIGGLNCSIYNQNCYSDKGGLEARGWKKEDKDAQSVSRSESEGRLEDSAASSDCNARQRSSSRHSRGSRKSKDIDISRSSNSGGIETPLTIKKTTPMSTPEIGIHTHPREAQATVNKEVSEVPRLPRVNTGACRASSTGVQFESVIIDDELLEKKLAALTTMPPTPLTEGKELTEDERHKQCEDLQIALLECAMEYEIKTIELKIKLKSLQSTPKHSEVSKSSSAEKDQTHYTKNSRESQIVESMKKQLFKLQREKGAVTKEYLSLQKKERKFEVQKRNLDDALLRVNRLQKELVRKDQELLDCQLMEKHIQAKLEEAEALAKTNVPQLEVPEGVEPAKLVALLPSLREWVTTIKKDHVYDPEIIKLMEGYSLRGEHTRIEPLRPRSTNEKLTDNPPKHVKTVVQSLVKEVQALQNELGKLGSRQWKHKNQALPWRCGLENRQWGRTARPKSPPLKVKRFHNR